MAYDDYAGLLIEAVAEPVDADEHLVHAAAEAEADIEAGRSVICLDEEQVEALLDSLTDEPRRVAG